MNKLDAISPSVTLSTLSPEPANWLIVLVPGIEADLTTATQRIWELANAGSRRIRFIGLYENTAQELILRRQLANMSAMVNNTGIYTETETIPGNDCVEVVRARSQVGDLIVCFAEQRVGPLKRSLSSILQSSLDIPIYILSSTYLENDVHLSWWAPIFAWAGFIAILAGFFLVQVRLHHLVEGWSRSAFVLTSVCLELWMIWVWNKLFS
jgi:hypothetical protein